MSETSCLTLDVKAGESVKLAGGMIVVEVCEKSGRTARLRVHAPRDVLIEKSTNTGEGGGPPVAPCMT